MKTQQKAGARVGRQGSTKILVMPDAISKCLVD